MACHRLSHRVLHSRLRLAQKQQVAFSHTFRQNAITGDWVVFSPQRASRPKQVQHSVQVLKSADMPSHDPDCPFCKGNEHLTPAPLLEMFDETTGDWTLRVVPNAFPAVTPFPVATPMLSSEEQEEEEEEEECPVNAVASHAAILRVLDNDNPLQNTTSAVGHHEVVIESPLHNARLGLMHAAATKRLLWAWRERGRKHRQDPRVRHVFYFKNHGGAAGASLVHSHSQVVALPIVSTNEANRLEQARRFYVRHQISVFQRTLELELKHKERVVEETRFFVAITPYASITAYETIILPKSGHAYYDEIDDEHLEDFSMILQRTLHRICMCLGEPSYNMVLRTAPHRSRQAYDYEQFFSWHCMIFPRLGAGAMAGFEIGTGIFSNSVFPEKAAADLLATPVKF